MMTCLVVADDEFPRTAMPEEKVDILISCGDLPDAYILAVAARCQPALILAVKGNHDSGAQFPAPIVDLHGRFQEFGGLRFGGFGGCQRYKSRGHHLYEQAEVETALDGFPPVDVFVAHNSPWGIHDDLRGDEAHQGFQAFNAYLARERPSMLIHGHQHVNRETRVEGTQVVGVYGHRLMALPGKDRGDGTAG